ncbi:hypothetical protein [Streptomyces sp. 4F14]|uniref:hypothetical protein n=1 Tax=Streptomyces sp. 4F14 TaxID=3394380 RepID=UPI003A890F39
MAADIARLLELGKGALEEPDITQADSFVETLRRILRPQCGYGYRFKKYAGCPIEVNAAGESCTEHAEWPLPDGSDPDTARCPGTPPEGEGTVTWVTKGMTVRLFGVSVRAKTSGAVISMRCPYPRRADGSPCALHDPRPEDRCGWPNSDGQQHCQEITALYGCPEHYSKKLSEEIKRIRHAATCAYCGAQKGYACTGRTEAYNDNVHYARKKKTDRQVDERLSRKENPPNSKFWELATFSTIQSG